MECFLHELSMNSAETSYITHSYRAPFQNLHKTFNHYAEHVCSSSAVMGICYIGSLFSAACSPCFNTSSTCALCAYNLCWGPDKTLYRIGVRIIEIFAIAFDQRMRALAHGHQCFLRDSLLRRIISNRETCPTSRCLVAIHTRSLLRRFVTGSVLSWAKSSPRNSAIKKRGELFCCWSCWSMSLLSPHSA